MITKWYEISCDVCGCGHHFPDNRKAAEKQFIDDGGVILKGKHICTEECELKHINSNRKVKENETQSR